MNNPFNIAIFYMVSGVILAIPAGLLLAATVTAIRNMVKKQGGLALLLTTVLGTLVGFAVGGILLLFINLSH